MSLLKAYADMWKNCFNFSGYTNRKDFAYCMVVNLVISNLFVINIFCDFYNTCYFFICKKIKRLWS